MSFLSGYRQAGKTQRLMREQAKRVIEPGGWVALGGLGAVEIPDTRRPYQGNDTDLVFEPDADCEVHYILRGWGSGSPVLIGLDYRPVRVGPGDRLNVGRFHVDWF